MNNTIKVLDNLSTSLDWLVTRLVCFLIAGMVLSTTLQIIFRVFFEALTWTEELSRYLLVWSTFFGATMAYKRGNHIAITFVVNSLRPGAARLLRILSYILSMAFFGIVTYYGWMMIKLQIFQISPALSIPMQYVYASIPVSLVIMMIHALAGLAKEIRDSTERVSQE